MNPIVKRAMTGNCQTTSKPTRKRIPTPCRRGFCLIEPAMGLGVVALVIASILVFVSDRTRHSPERRIQAGEAMSILLASPVRSGEGKVILEMSGMSHDSCMALVGHDSACTSQGRHPSWHIPVPSSALLSDAATKSASAWGNNIRVSGLPKRECDLLPPHDPWLHLVVNGIDVNHRQDEGMPLPCKRTNIIEWRPR